MSSPNPSSVKKLPYKSIHIDPDLIRTNTKTPYKHCVSFDTVAINYSDSAHHHYSEDDLYESLEQPPVTNSSFGDIDRLPIIRNFDGNGWRIDYPSESAIRNSAFTMSVKHPKYHEYLKENIGRKVIIYLTGRKHTWISLDFFIDKLLKDGDQLIITSRVPISDTDLIIRKGDQSSIWKKEIDPKIFKSVAENIIKYVHYITDPSRIIDITVDLFLSDSTVDILNESLHIYEPELIITSEKPNLRFQRIKSWNTSRITDRLVKNFSIPILVSPAFSMNEFEVEFFNQLKQKNGIPTDGKAENTPIVHDDSVEEYNPISNIPTIDITSDTSSILSTDSVKTTDSISFQELTKTITAYNQNLENFEKMKDDTIIDSDIFLDKLNKIADMSKRMDMNFSDLSNDEGENGEYIRNLYGLPKLEKHTSMLDVIDGNEEAMNNIKKTLTSARSPERVKPDLRRFKTSVDTSEPLSTKTADFTHLRPISSHLGITRTLSNSSTTSETHKKPGFWDSWFG